LVVAPLYAAGGERLELKRKGVRSEWAGCGRAPRGLGVVAQPGRLL